MGNIFFFRFCNFNPIFLSMGEADRYMEYKRPVKKIKLGSENNAIVALLAINIFFFLLLSVINLLYNYYQFDKHLFQEEALPYFAMPAKSSLLVKRPWTILTQMFSHIYFLHILSNMLWLWAFGYILQQISGNGKIIPVYIYGGLLGGLFYALAFNAMPFLPHREENSLLMGGNAGVMAVAVATTFLAPDFRFFRNIGKGIPIWVLTVFYVLADIVIIIKIDAALGIAHMGGAVAGWVYIYRLRKGKDAALWMHNYYDWFINLFNPRKKGGNIQNKKDKIFYDTKGREPYIRKATITQQRVDELLDKINQKGYQHLTDEEKKFLRKASEEDL